jgi:hypothetical protein
MHIWLNSIKCHYAECQNYLNVILSVVRLNVVRLNVVRLGVVRLNVVMLNVFMLSVVQYAQNIQ